MFSSCCFLLRLSLNHFFKKLFFLLDTFLIGDNTKMINQVKHESKGADA